MTHHSNGDLSQEMVLAIRQRLAGSDDNAFTGVNSHGIEIFHVAHGDAVVVAVADHFIFDFFPAGQILLNQHLRTVSEGPGGTFTHIVLIYAQTRAESTQGVGRPEHHRITDLLGNPDGLRNRSCGRASGYLDDDFG